MADDAGRAAGREKTSRPRERGRRRRVAPGPDALRRLERDSTLSPGPSSGAGCATRMKREHLAIGISLEVEAAEKLGDEETVRVCQDILRQEEAMAAWLVRPHVTRRYLRRESAEDPAKR